MRRLVVLLLFVGRPCMCFASRPACRPVVSAAATARTPVSTPATTAAAARRQPTVHLTADAGQRSPATSWFVRNRSLLLLLALVVHKCASDLLTRYTRLQGAYSINTVAMCAAAPASPLLPYACLSRARG